MHHFHYLRVDRPPLLLMTLLKAASSARQMVLTDAVGFFYYFAFGSNLLDERIHVQVVFKS